MQCHEKQQKHASNEKTRGVEYKYGRFWASLGRGCVGILWEFPHGFLWVFVGDLGTATSPSPQKWGGWEKSFNPGCYLRDPRHCQTPTYTIYTNRNFERTSAANKFYFPAIGGLVGLYHALLSAALFISLVVQKSWRLVTGLMTPSVCCVEMSAGEIEAETEQYRRQVIQLKAEYRRKRERLEALAAAYESSKQLNPAQRYPALKDMIKDICVVDTPNKT